MLINDNQCRCNGCPHPYDSSCPLFLSNSKIKVVAKTVRPKRAKQQLQADICPECNGRGDKIIGPGVLLECYVCKGTGKRPAV